MSNRVKASRGPKGRPPTKQSRQAPSWLVLAVAAGVVVVAAVVAAVVFIGGDDEAPETVRVNGVPLPELAVGGVDTAVGVKAPVFQAAPLGGRMRTVGSGGGPSDPTRVYVFVSHWCDGCDRAVRAAAELVAADGVPEGTVLEVITTAGDRDRVNHPVEDWLVGLGWTGTTYPDSGRGTLADAYGVVDLPTWVVLDNQNVVITRETGTADPAALVALAAQS